MAGKVDPAVDAATKAMADSSTAANAPSDAKLVKDALNALPAR